MKKIVIQKNIVLRLESKSKKALIPYPSIRKGSSAINLSFLGGFKPNSFKRASLRANLNGVFTGLKHLLNHGATCYGVVISLSGIKSQISMMHLLIYYLVSNSFGGRCLGYTNGTFSLSSALIFQISISFEFIKNNYR